MAEWLANILQLLTASPSLSVVEKIGFYATRWIGAVFLLCYAYQFFYIFLSFFKKPPTYAPVPPGKRYAAVIAARNEEAVLPTLLQSLRAQTYPGELIDIIVVADNCTDRTAELARLNGACVYEREDTSRIGKGYALAFLFERLSAEGRMEEYDAFLFFDADNVLREDYVWQMHNGYCAGHRVLTSYRNSKNYGKNWITAGYALWFLREARHLNGVRAALGCSAAITGTGFLLDRALLVKNGGWKHFLLTEDIEFTADLVLSGERVGYCHAAEFFDEQPERFAPSWRQRKRWAKGLFQVIRHYGGRLLRGALRGSWSCFDMLVSMMPAFLLSTLQLFSITALFVTHLLLYGEPSRFLARCFAEFWGFAYVLFFIVGVFALLFEWRRIRCPKWRRVLLMLTFPIFMLTYIPISVIALFTRVEWKPIRHTHALGTQEIDAQQQSKKK